MTRIMFAVLSAALLCMTGCSVPPPRFGVEQNDTRKANGIPVVESSWTVYQSLHTEVHWSTEYKFDGTAGHSGKKVFYRRNGPITGEEDYYYSGKKFIPTWDPDAGTISESLTISYDYAKANAPWTCTHCSKEDLATISLTEAEDLLHSWGLQRIN